MKELILTWDDIHKLLLELFPGSCKQYTTIYGVPSGGMVLAGYIAANPSDFKGICITHNVNEADFILDDLVDSGATKAYYASRFPEKPFVALFEKGVDFIEAGTWVQFPWETEHPGGPDSVQQNIVRQLQYIGEDPKREGLVKTPDRVVRSWGTLFSGYQQNPADLLTVFESDGYDQIVLLRDIELYSMCEHHILPFYGKAHVAYIPGGKVIGISKLARLVDIFARRLQIQERLGEQVTSTLMEHLKPRGAACIIEATHMCMRMRGVSKQNSVMTTSSMKGVFLENAAARTELMALIRG